MDDDNYDSGDYDTDDRVFCFYCHEWSWEGFKVCIVCEELICPECAKNTCESRHQIPKD